MKLSLKLFAAFFTTTLVIVGVFIVMQVFAARNFEAYLRQVVIEQSSPLLAELPALFDETDGWEPLRRDPRLWRELGRQYGFDIPAAPDRRMDDPTQRNRRDEPQDRDSNDRRPPPRDDRGGRERRPPPLGGQGRDRRERPPRESQPPNEHNENPRAPADPLGLGPRLSVHDASRVFVVGDRTPPHQLILRPIKIEGATVGWLGLRPKENSETPLETMYMTRQLRLVLVVGCCLLLVTGIVAVIVSRKVVRPVKALSRATRSLTRRNFETRITVDSNDEFGQLATDFNKMAKTIQSFERERRRWISDIAHELRTPLAILRGEIEAVQDGVRELRTETLDSLHFEVIRLGKLVEDLHQLAVTDSGAHVMRMSAIDLMDVVRDSVDSFRPRIEAHDISLQLNISATDSATIRGDHDRLQQVMTNLMENSLRYSGPGTVVSIRSSLNPHHVVLQVQDSGPGVPEDALPHLFERLYRVEKSRSRELGGSGLGLAICKQIIDAHNGEIRSANAESGGLIITIVLPLIVI